VTAIRALALLAFLAVVAAGCGDATKKAARPGLIALDRRIGPVRLGEPKLQITKALGRSVVARLSGQPLRFYSKVKIYVYAKVKIFLYPKAKIYVGYRPNPPKGNPTVAAFIVTRAARYKTRSGVGVGSSLRELRQRVTVRCHGDLCRHEPANFNLPFTVFDLDPTTTRITEIAIVPGAATGRCEPTSAVCVRGAAWRVSESRRASVPE
jgi:hypothetical protein